MNSFFPNNFILGPDLPIPLSGHKIVNFDGSVISIGGWNSNGPSDALFKLVCSTKECKWEKMAQKLKVARNAFVAMTIPDEMANCRAKVRSKSYINIESFFLKDVS